MKEVAGSQLAPREIQDTVGHVRNGLSTESSKFKLIGGRVKR